MTAFSPGQSPPPVRMPTRIGLSCHTVSGRRPGALIARLLLYPAPRPAAGRTILRLARRTPGEPSHARRSGAPRLAPETRAPPPQESRQVRRTWRLDGRVDPGLGL